MRRRTALLLALGLAFLLTGGSLLVASRDTLAEPRRACAPTSPLRLAFGEPTAEGIAQVPIFAENVGANATRAYVSFYEVDAYRVRWDGRLVPLPTMSVNVDFVAGYEGELLAPGERTRVGEWQPGDARGEILLLAFTQGACGEARVRV